MLLMSAVTYGFNLIAARWLLPAQFGALTALLSIILIANVVSLGLQAAVARRLATAPADRDLIIATTARVSLWISLAVGVCVALSTVAFTPALSLDSHWPVIFCGAMITPLTLMGAQAGVAQGTSQWRRLSWVYVGNGFGRLLGGTLGLAVDPSATGAMIGLAAGAWLPVLCGVGLLRSEAGIPRHSRRPLVFETYASSVTLFAYFTLSNLDALLGRSLFDQHDSGIYAAGLIMTKSALFLPQFVSVVFFPSLARDAGHRSRLVAVAWVAMFGGLAVGLVAFLPRLALILVGGDKYAEVAGQLWVFALSGTVLAIVYVLVFDALARQVRGASLILWLAVFTIAGAAMVTDPSLIHLVVLVASTSSIAAVLLLALPWWQDRRHQSNRPGRTARLH